MTNTNSAASTAHKDAATEHKVCAEHHMKAAASLDDHKADQARASSKEAMKHCDTASKHSAAACAGSTQ